MLFVATLSEAGGIYFNLSDLLPEGPSGYQSTTMAPSGSGVAISDIHTIFEIGMMETTGRDLDAGMMEMASLSSEHLNCLYSSSLKNGFKFGQLASDQASGGGAKISSLVILGQRCRERFWSRAISHVLQEISNIFLLLLQRLCNESIFSGHIFVYFPDACLDCRIDFYEIFFYERLFCQYGLRFFIAKLRQKSSTPRKIISIKVTLPLPK